MRNQHDLLVNNTLFKEAYIIACIIDMSVVFLHILLFYGYKKPFDLLKIVIKYQITISLII